MFFPLQAEFDIQRDEPDGPVPTHEPQKTISDVTSNQMFAALMLKNSDTKTPLHLAIENNRLWYTLTHACMHAHFEHCEVLSFSLCAAF